MLREYRICDILSLLSRRRPGYVIVTRPVKDTKYIIYPEGMPFGPAGLLPAIHKESLSRLGKALWYKIR